MAGLCRTLMDRELPKWHSTLSKSKSRTVRAIVSSVAIKCARADERWLKERHNVVHYSSSSYRDAGRDALQVCIAITFSLAVPIGIFFAAGRRGAEVSHILYAAIVTIVVLNSIILGMEAWYGIHKDDAQLEQSDISCPAASAIIVAYLPNETTTLLGTIGSFMQLDYPGSLQIIIAYNTPHFLPIETELQELGRHEPRLELIRVNGSTSKAQNINAAACRVTGEFVGIFDSDHHPDPKSFVRAWRHLSNGHDVVQGRCVIRNADASWVTRLVAVEYETLYAVSHPGRTRLHRFGLFGGSNGYWRTPVLCRTLMNEKMLTEDIDATMRVLQEGGKIAFDRSLISRELAPETLRALWNQRIRWSQGWFQVSLKHLWPALSNRHLSTRQKLGVLFLLAWSAVFPWLSCQIVPILLYWSWCRGERLNWLIPLFVVTTVIALCTVPLQVVCAFRWSSSDLQRHRWWFAFYILLSTVFYNGFKSLIAQVAHIKETTRDRHWKVTPRE